MNDQFPGRRLELTRRLGLAPVIVFTTTTVHNCAVHRRHNSHPDLFVEEAAEPIVAITHIFSCSTHTVNINSNQAREQQWTALTSSHLSYSSFRYFYWLQFSIFSGPCQQLPLATDPAWCVGRIVRVWIALYSALIHSRHIWQKLIFADQNLLKLRAHVELTGKGFGQRFNQTQHISFTCIKYHNRLNCFESLS